MMTLARRLRPPLRVAATACRVRFRLDRPFGPLFLAAAVIDPFIYSVVVYFVIATVFGRAGPERFHLILLGFIAFRWTLSCLLRAHDFGFLRRRMAEHSTHGLSCALAAIMAPATLAFCLSLVLAFVTSLLWSPPDRSFAALWLLPPVVLAQGAWTAVLVLAVAMVEARSIAVRDTFLVTVAAIVWFLSPVMFQFIDVPAHASGILSFNPVSHVMAAFHNTYWYGRIPNFLTLGIAISSAIVILLAVRHVERRRFDHSRHPAPPKENSPLLVVRIGQAPMLAVVGDASAPVRAARYERWDGRVADIAGNGLVALLLASREERLDKKDERIAAIGADSAIGALFGESIALYPDAALDQLAFTIALACEPGPILLDRLLDNAATDFIWKSWTRRESRAEAGAATTVITERYLGLSAGARGTFRFVGPSGVVAEGRIGPQLAAQYEKLAVPQTGRQEAFARPLP